MQYSYQTYYCVTIEKEISNTSLLMFYNPKKKEFEPLLTKDCLYGDSESIEIDGSFVHDKTLTIHPVKLVPDGTGEEFDEEVVPE